MSAPKLPSLFKAKKPRTFEFPTRFYDAEKEQRAQRKNELQSSPESIDPVLYKKMDEKLRNQRLLIILCVLLIGLVLYAKFV